MSCDILVPKLRLSSLKQLSSYQNNEFIYRNEESCFNDDNLNFGTNISQDIKSYIVIAHIIFRMEKYQSKGNICWYKLAKDQFYINF